MDGLSIIIPCWNRENFIARAIDSCLNQDIENLEVIVVDDGSTDRSVEIIRSYSDKVRLIEIPHKGACAARNIGWKSANYNLIKFLDSDDVFLKKALSSQVNYFKNLTDAGRGEDIIVFGDTFHVSELRPNSIQKSNYKRFPKKRDEQVSYLLMNNIQTSSPLHQKKLLEKIGGFDESWPSGQEWNLHLRLCSTGAIFHYQSAIITKVFDHKGVERISNSPRTHFHLIEGWNRLKKFLLIELPILKGAPFDVKENLAVSCVFWNTGRRAIKMGFNDLASDIFSTTIRISNGVIPRGKLYTICVKIFGVMYLEKSRIKFVNLVTKFRRTIISFRNLNIFLNLL